MTDVWGAYGDGYRIGDTMRTRRNEREQARAYGEGGWDATRDAAVRQGDLRGVENALDRGNQEQVNQLQRRAATMQWFRTNAPAARNLLRAARGMDPQRRTAFLTQQQQRFIEMGFSPEQVQQGIAALSNPETAEQAFAEFDAAFGQYEQPDWNIETVLNQDTNTRERRAVAVGPDGTIQQGPNAIPADATGRMASEQEVTALGLRPGTSVWLEPGQPPRVVQSPLAPRNGRGSGGPDAAPDLPPGFQWE